MRPPLIAGAALAVALAAATKPDASQEFTQSVRPVLLENCGACHNPDNPKNRVDFLKAKTAADLESRRGLWRDVAAQLRNRTMPPVASKLTEAGPASHRDLGEDRLRQTACNAGDYAGPVALRRLNRREYRNTVRDLLGVDLAVTDIFPADGTGGEGFDTNGETLYVPPLMMERYMEAAQQILDRVIITPPLQKTFASAIMQPAAPSDKPGRMLAEGQELSAEIPIFMDGEYNLRVSIERPKDRNVQVGVKVDGVAAGNLTFQRDPNGAPTNRAQSTRLARGVHTISVVGGKFPVEFYSLTVEQRQQEPSAEKRALHFRLFGMEPGEAPLEPRKAARQLLAAIPAEGLPASGRACRDRSIRHHVRSRGGTWRSVRGTSQAGAQGGAGIAAVLVPNRRQEGCAGYPSDRPI